LAEILPKLWLIDYRWLVCRPSKRGQIMSDLIIAILTGGLAAFLALFVVSFLVLGLLFGIVHLIDMVLHGLEDDRVTVHQKQTL
jgi:ABC-type transport system involved in multi-copper enzyme maturation permease subunit